MPIYNQNLTIPLIDIYQQGFLPQRNNRHYFYSDTSCRSDLKQFELSSENRRIINKTNEYKFSLIPLSKFKYTVSIKKKIFSWVKKLGWDFPAPSIKTVFTDHIFNNLYIWTNDQNQEIAYSLCYFDNKISHIGYVFYDPIVNHSNLPIRLVLQFVIDSHQKGLDYAYLGRFSESLGFYKRNMPGFEYYSDGQWLKY